GAQAQRQVARGRSLRRRRDLADVHLSPPRVGWGLITHYSLLVTRHSVPYLPAFWRRSAAKSGGAGGRSRRAAATNSSRERTWSAGLRRGWKPIVEDGLALIDRPQAEPAKWPG